jgi:hypothetical protein
MDRGMGKLLIVAGVIIVLAGIILLFKDQIPGIRFLGRLPGDIIIRRKNFSCYFPLATSIIISIILSILLYLFNRFR